MSAEPLFHEQMSLGWGIPAPVVDDTPNPKLKSAAPLHDAVVMGASRDHQLVPDDEESLSRIIQLHSEDKDHYAFYYADIVSQAMTGKFPALAWVELFAGPGRLWVEPRNAYVDGSPVRAMKVRKPYDIYVFNDLDPAPWSRACAPATTCTSSTKTPTPRPSPTI